MDWNSFFSTMAQASAGLIAIIAAFVISKLLGENEKQEKLEGEIDDLIIRYDDLIQKISIRNFKWYDQQKIYNSSTLEKAIRNTEFSNLSEDEKLKKLFNILPDLFKTENCSNYLNKIIKEIRDRGPYPLIHVASTNRLWDNLNAEKELVIKLKINSKNLINNLTKQSLILYHPIKILRLFIQQLIFLHLRFSFR